MKSELEAFISDNIEAFYSRTPDPAVLERIQQKMKGGNRKKKEQASVILLRPRWAVAAACLLLLAGGLTYLALQPPTVPQTVMVTTNKPAPTTQQTIVPEPQPEKPSIENKVVAEMTVPTERNSDLEKETYLRENLLFTKLSDQESPSRRLAAATQLAEITSMDHDIVDALAKTMNSDPNTNVRLAALDALSKFCHEPYVKKKLLSSLRKQKDPMVQIALIELLTKMREASILKQLNRMVSDDNTMQAVKDQAYSGILLLHS